MSSPHDARVTELLQSANREVLRRRIAEHALRKLHEKPELKMQVADAIVEAAHDYEPYRS